jgi:hypothetical protein
VTRGAPGPYGLGHPGRLACAARDTSVACGAGGAVDVATLQRGGSRPQGARELPAEAARAVADARLLLQGRLPPAPLCPLATMTPAGVATAAIVFTLAATPAPALSSPLTLSPSSAPPPPSSHRPRRRGRLPTPPGTRSCKVGCCCTAGDETAGARNDGVKCSQAFERLPLIGAITSLSSVRTPPKGV